MRLPIILGLLIAQALLAFLAYPNFILPESNLLSASLIFFVPMITVLIGLIYNSNARWKIFLFVGLSGLTTIMPAAHYLIGMEYFYAGGIYFLGLLGILFFLMYGFVWLFCHWLLNRFTGAQVFIVPVVFTALAFIRLAFSFELWMIPSSFHALTYPLVGLPILVQMAAFTGLLGPECLVWSIGTIMAFVLWQILIRVPVLRQCLELPEEATAMPAKPLMQNLGAGAILLVLFAVLLGLGNMDAFQIAQKQKESTAKFRPALLQSGFDLFLQAQPGLNHPRLKTKVFETGKEKIAGALMENYRYMIQLAAKAKADLLVFSEGAFPITLPRNRRLWSELKYYIQTAQVPALVGLFTDIYVRNHLRVLSVWYYMDTEGVVQGYYVKRALVPMGEYLPLRWVLNLVLTEVNFILSKTQAVFQIDPINIHNSDLLRGEKGTVFESEHGKIFMVVNGELKYPKFFREGVCRGGEAVISLGTAFWIRSPIYFNRQLQICSIRAIESRRWIAHMASFGGSAQVDALGVIKKRSAFGKPSVFVATMPCLTGKTFYARFGNLLGWLCLLAVIGLAVGAGREHRQLLLSGIFQKRTSRKGKE